MEFSKGADLLVHDSEFTNEDYLRTKGWGHSRYEDAFRLAEEAGVKKFGMFHHNQEREDDAVDEIVKNCLGLVKDRKINVDCFAVAQGMEIDLE